MQYSLRYTHFFFQSFSKNLIFVWEAPFSKNCVFDKENEISQQPKEIIKKFFFQTLSTFFRVYKYNNKNYVQNDI